MRVVSEEAVAEELWPGKHMEGKYCPVYDLDISDSVEACINKLADINIFITGKTAGTETKSAGSQNTAVWTRYKLGQAANNLPNQSAWRKLSCGTAGHHHSYNQQPTYIRNTERWTRRTPKTSEAALTSRDETKGVGDSKSTRVERDQQAYALEQGAVMP